MQKRYRPTDVTAPTLILPAATQDFQDPATKTRITQAVQVVITASFRSHPMRHMTKSEVTRRFNVCFEGYRVMRNEMKWSSVRCIDMLQRILEASLNGTDIDFSKRSSWFGAA